MQLSVTWGPEASVSPGKLQMCRNVGPIQISWIFIFNYFIFIEIHLIYNVVFISGNSKVIQLHTHTHTHVIYFLSGSFLL